MSVTVTLSVDKNSEALWWVTCLIGLVCVMTHTVLVCVLPINGTRCAFTNGQTGLTPHSALCTLLSQIRPLMTCYIMNIVLSIAEVGSSGS